MLLLVVLLAGCSPARRTDAEPGTAAAAGDLEAAAIEAGIVPDPGSTDLTGLYSRETDRVCVVPDAKAYRIGVFVDYGDQQSCGATGRVSRDGEDLRVELDGASGCRFDARFEGDRILFPGRLPDACQKLCVGRASMAALQVDRLSETASEASTLRNAKGILLCDSGR